MEPPKPERKREILAKAPTATAEEYDEYERLLSKRYMKKPAGQPGAAAAPDPDEARLEELRKKLFAAD